MTRRTPQPGDSYTKGDVTWRVTSVHPRGTVIVETSYGILPFSMEAFHQAVAIATWGRE